MTDIDKSRNIVVGLDIGTTKISLMVGKMNEYKKLEIVAQGKSESYGVSRGIVANIDRTVESIKEAINQASQHYNINEVYVGIAGQHIKSLQHRGEIVRDDVENEINISDMKKLKENMFKLITIPGEEVIHVIPQEYTVDGEDGIQDPRGMAGIKLSANFHVITAQVGAVRNIIRCVEKAGLRTKELILEPFASALATLDEDELREGVALVDIGGGTTDVAIFLDKVIRHTAVIPFGGNVITKDIKTGLSILEKQAELLKVKFGSAVHSDDHDNVMVSIPGLRGREPKEISVKNLTEIISARMKEIIDLVYHQIKVYPMYKMKYFLDNVWYSQGFSNHSK
jgi:cell division protein FtsA